jgi:MFS family permease
METGPTNQQQESTLKTVLRSFRHRNFRLYFIGQNISMIGTWMQRIAVGWLVYRLTNSAFLLGVVGFASQVPTFLLASFAGVMADRHSRHRILLLTQVLAMAQALILALLVLFHLIQIWHVILLSIVLGIINAFDMPTRQSFVMELVEDKRDLNNAIGLNSTMVNGARLLGPSAAGMLIAAVGEGLCFLINAISFVAVIFCLLLLKIKKKDIPHRQSRILQELKEGFQYAAGFAPIRDVLLIFALVNLVAMPYVVLLPVFAKDVLNGGPRLFGYLMGGVGLGAVMGAAYLASRKNVRGLIRRIPFAVALFGSSLMVFSFSRSVFLSVALMVAAGVGQMVLMAGSNTLLQTLADDDKRGRVMSFFTMAFMGATPVGSLIAGSLASKIGAPWTLFIGGMCSIAGAFFFTRRLPAIKKLARPIYIKMGIIPELAAGIQNETEMSIHRE